jgi:hypothetical protein
MDFYLQLGWGMMSHCEALLARWGGGTVILSPRDLEPQQLLTFARKVHRVNGKVLLDPQVYLPYANHSRLQSHDYWDRGYTTLAFWSGQGLKRQLTKLLELNRQLSCSAFILPGLYASAIDDDWLEYQCATIASAQALEDNQFELITTVVLSADVTRNPDQIHDLVEAAKNWDISTIYLICEPPNGQYLVDNSAWLANVVDLIAGLRLGGKKVFIGYCSHQMLLAGCTSANAIASGTWLNVRFFTSGKFHEQEPEESRRTTCWYYCPQALSEFKISTLDLAAMQGMLPQLQPLPGLENDEAKILFSGSQPSSTGFGGRESFRHYLQALRTQVLAARRGSYDDSVQFHKNLLDSAEKLLKTLHDAGIRDRARDFEQVIDANRGALSYLETSRGVILRRYWNKLG